MFIFAILVLGSFGQLNAVPRTCNTTDYCTPVPAEFCDKSLCQPFDWDQIAYFGHDGVKSETWAIGQKVYLGHYCPVRYRIDESIMYDGMHSANVEFQMDSGAYCNNTSGTTTMPFVGVPDPYTGKFHTVKIIQAGETYEACFIYLVPEVSFIYRTCRVDPPPEEGMACATLYAQETSAGDCNKEPFVKFLRSLGYDFPQNVVDCVNEHTVFFDKYS